jgi:hypothetical protein
MRVDSKHTASVSVPATIYVTPPVTTPEDRRGMLTVSADSAVSQEDAVATLRAFAQSILRETGGA